MTIPDLFATFYTLLGIDYKHELEVEGRPVPLTENGKVRKFVLRERGVTERTWDRERDEAYASRPR